MRMVLQAKLEHIVFIPKYRKKYCMGSGSVMMLAISALLGTHVNATYEGQFKPQFGVVVVTRSIVIDGF